MLWLLLLLGSGFAFFFGFDGCFDAGCGGNAALELVYAAHGVEQFLLAGIKRVALAANFGMQFFNRRSGCKTIAASTGHNGAGVKLGVNVGFHNNLLRKIK